MIIRSFLALFLLSLSLQAVPIGQTGLLESKLSYEFDSTSTSGGKFVHFERLAWGFQGSSNALDLNYQLNLGGVLQGNSELSYNKFSPEYGVRTSLKPISRMDMALFSYSRLRNPMQVLRDSVEFKEYVHGLQIGAQLSKHTRFSISTGLKSRQIVKQDSISSTQQFLQLHLDQRLAGMQFRIASESDMLSNDVDDDKHYSTTSVQWYGSPLKALRWNAMNTLYQTDQYQYWRISHHVNYSLSQRQKLWAVFNQGDFAYGSNTLLRRNYDLKYRFQWKPKLGVDLVFAGNRVSVPDSIDLFHWRSYASSIHWNFGKTGFARGKLNTGFKESYRYGKGLDVLFSASEALPLLSTKLVDVEIRDDLSAEYFQRFDETGDPRYDIRHKFRFTTEFLPGSKFRVGNHIKFHNHFGSDLDFSPDTLRNAVLDEIYFKVFHQKTQLSLNYRTVYEILDSENDLHFNFNARLYRSISQNLSASLMSMYRFQSEVYADYLWFSGTLKYHTQVSSYALEVQSTGDPEFAFKQDARIWLRFVRRI